MIFGPPTPPPSQTQMFTEYLGQLLTSNVLSVWNCGFCVPWGPQGNLPTTHLFSTRRTPFLKFLWKAQGVNPGSCMLSWPYLFERTKLILMFLYSIAQEDSQKCPISFACDFSIEAAVASQRGRTKTSRTGSGCPPCRCRAPSSTCSSSWPGWTCSLLAEDHIHFHDRSAPAVLQMCT